MPSNKRQKELARRRAERQAARRAAERARRRKRRTILGLTIGGVAAAVVVLLLVLTTLNDDDKGSEALDDPSATPTPSASADEEAFKKFPVACGAKRPKEAKPQSFGDKPPKMTIDKAKTYEMTLKTSCGDIVVALDAKNAPNTVNSFHFLAGKDFYDGSICHRMSDQPTFSFIQCGDPSGTGAGDAPGYKLAEENTEGAKYERGTLAMANTGQPTSTGSQFFLLSKPATELPPNYTVAGKITKGIEVLDKIIKLGTDGAFDPSPGGGHPKQAVYLEDVTVKES
ncbi:MAG TPA: peptidylprolyl isomerase [Frankiaceae bacterium]|nr:peptidylprolyl isomerase [Frankiaceae bacterium]